VVFIVYTGRDLPEYEMISQSMSKVIEKLYGIANEADKANT
jgi:hypothetical protein